jgi:catalase
MLQGRLFSYGDTHRYRLGINHHQIPVNAPRCPFHSFHRDGAGRTDGNLGATENYEPNRFGSFAQSPAAAEPPLSIDGAADHYDHRVDDDYYSQPAALFRLFDQDQRRRLFGNIARSIRTVPAEIQQRQFDHFRRIDPAYAEGVIEALRAV